MYGNDYLFGFWLGMVLLSLVGAWIGAKKNRPVLGASICSIAGIFGVILIALLPKKKQ